jgi:DNA-binding transcriptional LysR family regulator
VLNILQVQQFYYVGLHRGISAAARQMPERRTPSAINKAMLQLEATYGQPLFQRAPFRFTPAGHAFWDFIRVFFEGLERFLTAAEASGCELRVAGSDVALNYLSDLLELLRARDASARVKLRCGSQSQMHTWLRDGAIDVLIAPRQDPLPPGIAATELVTLPLVLLVPKRKTLTSAAELWARPKLAEPLIVPGPSESVTVNFAAGLRTMRREWTPAIDANSLESVARSVADGQGIGLVVDEPSLARRPGVRALPLPGFEPVTVMAFCRTPARPLEKLLIEVLRHRAARTWPQRKRTPKN